MPIYIYISPESPRWRKSVWIGVKRVIDGDTIVGVRSLGQPRTEHKYRLVSIDAPERRQPYGHAAARALRRLLADRAIYVYTAGTDRYRRTLAVLYIQLWNGVADGIHWVRVNDWMVRQGWAWAYNRNDAVLRPLENAAREERLGLWQEVDEETPVHPRTFRRLQRKQHTRHKKKNPGDKR